VSTDRKAQVSSLDARDDLLFIVDRWPRLAALVGGSTGNALTGLPGAASIIPLLVIDVNIVDLMWEIEEKVARFYGQILMAETNWTPATSAMPALLNEVAARFGHFTESDDQMALGFADDASEYRAKVEKVLDQSAPPKHVGPCQTYECIGELYVGQDKDGGTCKVCGAPFTTFTQRRWLAGELDTVLKTQAEIIQSLKILDLGVADSTVWSWVRRKQLVPVQDGLYRLADAIALIKAPRKIAA